MLHVVLDDVRWDDIEFMPDVLARVRDKGVSFERAYTDLPTCEAARFSILTGQHEWLHGVNLIDHTKYFSYGVIGRDLTGNPNNWFAGPWERIRTVSKAGDDPEAASMNIVNALKRDATTPPITALVGKYTNSYAHMQSLIFGGFAYNFTTLDANGIPWTASRVPPDWDYWFGVVGEATSVPNAWAGEAGGENFGGNQDSYHSWITEKFESDTSNIRPAAPTDPLAISTLTCSGTTATATTSTAHGLTTGMRVLISNVTPTGYNGSYLITVTGSTTFTYTAKGTGLASGAATSGSAVMTCFPTGDAKGAVSYYNYDKAIDKAHCSWSGGIATVKVFDDASGRNVGHGMLPGDLVSIEACIPTAWNSTAPVAPPSTLPAITSCIRTGGTVTVVFASAHAMQTGMQMALIGFAPTDYNGLWPVTVTNATTVTFPISTTPAATTVTGTAGAAVGVPGVAFTVLTTPDPNTFTVAIAANPGTMTTQGTAYPHKHHRGNMFASKCLDFLGRRSDNEPWYLYLTVDAAHQGDNDAVEGDRRYRTIVNPNGAFYKGGVYGAKAPDYDSVQAAAPGAPAQWAQRQQSIIHFNDTFRTILDYIEGRGWAGSTMIIFQSDQGVHYGEHGPSAAYPTSKGIIVDAGGKYFAKSTASEACKFMQWVRHPQWGGGYDQTTGKSSGQRIYDVTHHMDEPLTILDYFGLTNHAWHTNRTGISLARVRSSANPYPERGFYIQHDPPDTGDVAAFVGPTLPEGQFKWYQADPGCVTTGYAVDQLYDVATDPDELNNLAVTAPTRQLWVAQVTSLARPTGTNAGFVPMYFNVVTATPHRLHAGDTFTLTGFGAPWDGTYTMNGLPAGLVNTGLLTYGTFQFNFAYPGGVPPAAPSTLGTLVVSTANYATSLGARAASQKYAPGLGYKAI